MCDGCPPSAEHIYSRAVLTGNVPGKKNITQNGRFTTQPKYSQNMKSESSLVPSLTQVRLGDMTSTFSVFFYI